MKSRPIGPGQTILASQNNDKRDDARGGGFLLAHQQLGTIALPTNPSNTQTLTLDINGTNVVVTFVTSIGSSANNVLIGASAAATTQNLVNFLRRPDLTNSTQIAASSANQSLLQYCGYAWPGSSTNIVPFSLNKNVNGLTGPLTSFNITTTVTSGSWTAQTMQLYVQDGTYYIAGTRYLFTGGSTPTVTAPVSHPRIDVLTINSSGTLAWTTGTESSSPVAPTYPVGNVAICELYNVVSETALYDNENQQSSQGYIYNDVRPSVVNPYGQFILDPGSEAQGDILYFNGSAWVLLAPGTSGYTLQTKGASANPLWALASLGHQVLDGTGGSATITFNSTWQTIVSYASLPALTAGQSLMFAVYGSVNTNSTSETAKIGIGQAGSPFATMSITGTSGGPLNLVMYGIISFPSSTSTGIGFAAANQGTAAAPSLTTMGNISTSSNFGSTWTLTIQGWDNHGSGSNTFSVSYVYLATLN
jgi:hypothetical protein